MIKFSLEDFTRPNMTDINTLSRDNWGEVSGGNNGELDVNWDQYLTLENAGIAYLFVARNEGKMVGYAIFVVLESIHNKGIFQATCTVMYIMPEHRKKGTGARFIMFCQKFLTEANVDVIIMSVKPTCDYSDSLLRMGYSKSETLYDMRLS